MGLNIIYNIIDYSTKGIGDKVQQNHYVKSDPTERTLTTGCIFHQIPR